MSNRTFDNESDIIGLSCTLSTAYKGYTEGVIVEVCQNAHLLFYAQSPDFHKLGLCYYLKNLYL